MLSTQPGPDPYFVYKLHHAERAKQTWILSEDFGLYEALREGPATVAEVSQRIGLEQRPTAALLAANVCLGVVAREGEHYHIYEVMREMVLDGGVARTKPYPGAADPFWHPALTKALKTNAPLPEELPTWLSNPNATEGETAFAPDRHGWRILWGRSLGHAFDFSPFRTVADLGGATGGVLVGLTEVCPHLEGILVELPYARASAEEAIRHSGAEDRVRVATANMFEEELPPADAYFMSHVIHDWEDERCIGLLKRCHEALPANSPVLVQEYLLEDDLSGSLIGVFQWFGLLLSTTGDQRNGAQIGALMEAAGLVDIEIRPIDHEQSIVIGWKR